MYVYILYTGILHKLYTYMNVSTYNNNCYDLRRLHSSSLFAHAERYDQMGPHIPVYILYTCRHRVYTIYLYTWAYIRDLAGEINCVIDPTRGSFFLLLDHQYNTQYNRDQIWYILCIWCKKRSTVSKILKRSYIVTGTRLIK